MSIASSKSPKVSTTQKESFSELKALEFLEGLEATIIKTGQNKTKDDVPADKNTFDNARIRAISSRAMDSATDKFFDLMEKNIDRWTYDASSSILSSLAMQSSDNLIEQRREAADIQVKSQIFNNEFRAFFIESLVNFNCEEPMQSESNQPALELVSSDGWKSHNLEPLLAREYEGQTRIEFSQLNLRLGAILDRPLSTEENVLGPKAIAWTVSSALNECGYSKKQRQVLEPIVIADFNRALEHLYHEINQIWIELDILPDAKLEVIKSDAA